jgi:hypothetical protein
MQQTTYTRPYHIREEGERLWPKVETIQVEWFNPRSILKDDQKSQIKEGILFFFHIIQKVIVDMEGGKGGSDLSTREITYNSVEKHELCYRKLIVLNHLYCSPNRASLFTLLSVSSASSIDKHPFPFAHDTTIDKLDDM